MLMMTGSMLAAGGCGSKEAADTGAEQAEETEKESKEDKKEDKEDKPEEEPLEGSYWVGEDEDFNGELFLYEDGSFYYREAVIEDDGLPGYDCFGADKLTWKENGKKIEFTVKWGYAAEDSDEDVDTFSGKLKDGKLVVEELLGGEGEKYTFVRSEWPDLPSLDDAPKMVGDWRMVASSLEGQLTVYGEDDWIRKYLQITEKGGKYYCSGQEVTDGELSSEWNSIGMTLTDSPVYDGFYNSFWRADLDEDTDDGIWREITLYNGNVLTLVESNYDPEDYQEYTFISYQYFVRNDVDADEVIRDLVCPEKITVSDIHELAEAIRPGADITLKGGIYNFSELERKEQTDHLICSEESDEIWWNIACERLSIRAASGEKVEIVTENPFAPVLSIRNSNVILIEGITAGHKVSMSACGEPVVYLNGDVHVHINDCNLYGCGTYGIDAYFSNDIAVKRTEIYDCSVGAITIDDCATMHLYDCTIRDNYDGYGGLFQIYYDSCLIADDCVIKYNSTNYGEMIQAYYDSEASFCGCTFMNNYYDDIFAADEAEDVIFTNCEFD